MARVERIEPSATTRVSALGIEEQRVEVLLALTEAPPATLGHGFRVSARITTDRADTILRVPVAALFRSGGDWTVYAAEDGRAVLRLVSIGRRNDEMAEVLDGLEDGDTVILHPADDLRDKVRVVQ